MPSTTIEFIGIILFTTQLATSQSTAPTGGTTPTVVAIIPTMPSDIISHTPMIVFPTATLNTVKGWTANTLRPGLSYVAFDKGDQITIMPGVRNQPLTTAPAFLPHLQRELFDANKVQYDLQAGYKPPYASAAAVINLPEGNLSGCTSMSHGGRVDTIVNLDTNGTLVLSAGTNKSLSLNVTGADGFAIANVPLSYAQSPDTSGMGNHSTAYCQMEDGTVKVCPPPTPISGIGDCDLNPIMRVHPKDPPNGDPRHLSMAMATTAPPRPVLKPVAMTGVVTTTKSPTTVPAATVNQSKRMAEPPSTNRPTAKPDITVVKGSTTPTTTIQSAQTPAAPSSATLPRVGAVSTWAGSADCSNTQWP